ncbi:glutamyl-tRNA(gln) amidotransferase subunit A [Fusarium pseudoanthophilum]|uniref:Glutamyl-tRNA(Gln) amidotransferase subunit A n=1 Tax=Fusarium pseudoanthophilum TaxID=48495 RepID=A0A8H5KJF3_9HYPO|nr:glutamyl-tRNA(gln) amidotransferase subunit A [Fusarium pseudoanthophilum]
MDWKSLVAKKKGELEAAIPQEWRIKNFPTDNSVMSFPKDSGILTSEELVITESPATELVQDLAAGKLTSVAVTTAFFLYVKTSVPQSLMVCETINNIIGRTVNPRNKNWSCGGSSGGEGAIVGFRGGVIGVGTDIGRTIVSLILEESRLLIEPHSGGSIRVPAAFNFLYGLKPSHGRLPYGKMANSMEGQETIHSVCGPICHSVADMRLFVTSVLSQKPWSFDSKVLPHPPILRAIQTVVDKLSEAGHTVLPWEPYRHSYAHDLANSIYASDGGVDIFSTLNASGEPAIPNISDLVKPDLPKMNLNELWDAQLQKWNYQSEYLTKIREFEEKNGRQLDAIIAPITPTAAIRHNQFKYYGYATVINVLDFTSVVVPVTFADKAIDHQNKQFKPLTELDRIVQAEYDPDAYHGAPVAVQIIGRRLTEERVMSIAEEGHMNSLDVSVSQGSQSENIGGSTDMGNVSQAIPGRHGIIGIQAPLGTFSHNHAFAEAAGTKEAHLRILEAAKGMALTAWSAIVDDKVFAEIQDHFDKMKKADENLSLRIV